MRCTVTEHSVDPVDEQVTGSELPKDIQGQGSVLWGCKAVGPQNQGVHGWETDRAPEPRALSGCVESEMNIVTRGALCVVPLLGAAKTQTGGRAPQCTLSLSLA